MTDCEKLLRELIAIPSVNPAFLPPGDPLAGETRVAECLATLARRASLDVEFEQVFPGRQNLIARLSPCGKPRRRILLAPHLDTVGQAGAAHNVYNPRSSNGRLFGRGACDTKGSVAAMFSALLRLAKEPCQRSETEIVFVGLVDEENGQGGSRALVEKGWKADLAIVGEPTCLKVVTAHKGDLWLQLETSGKSAHGSTPHLGRNAVHEMARIVDLLETKYAAELRQRQHPLLGHPTVNVGSIIGGSQPNIVPAQCTISIDRRTIPGETERGVRREITTLLRANGLRAEFVNLRNAPCPALETDPTQPLVRQFLNHARQKKPEGVNYFCDAAVLSAGGIPSIVFGPGDIAQAHTADEWISISSLERGTDLLTRYLQLQP
ncbi:MAG TPA: M20/M25/M40 family metallo-hydrolase [Verrucomicrobiae bacterium]|nr:M20/M25/M40 family metallo-hydrolase [Verrucomicrobiae bacterium]